MPASSLTCNFTSFTVRPKPQLKKLPKEEKGGEDKEKEDEDGDGQVVQEDAWPRRRGQALRPDWQCGRGAG